MSLHVHADKPCVGGCWHIRPAPADSPRTPEASRGKVAHRLSKGHRPAAVSKNGSQKSRVGGGTFTATASQPCFCLFFSAAQQGLIRRRAFEKAQAGLGAGSERPRRGTAWHTCARLVAVSGCASDFASSELTSN